MTPVGASTDLAAGCAITVGGPLDPALAARLTEVRVETTRGLPDVCTLRLAEAAPDGSGSHKVIDDARFKLGAPLTVKLAAAIGGTLKPVFDGEIVTVEADIGTDHGGEPALELIVTALDRSHRMHRTTTTRTLRQVTMTDVARKVAGEHGLKIGKLADTGGGPVEELHQVGETDWAFLDRLVRDRGGELDVAEGALHIIDPSKPTPPVAELVWGENMERFRARASTVGQVAKVDVSGWDPKSKRAVSGSAIPKATTTAEKAALDSAVSGSQLLVATARVTNQAEAVAEAKGIAGRLGDERVQIEAWVTGDPILLAGCYVNCAGVGTRFAGKARIACAVHTYGARGYRTRLTLGAGGRPLAQALNGAARAPAFTDHLVVGIVTSNVDPESLGRVKVSYPTLREKQVESGWARIAREASGAARGTVALPHVNDEVVIGFENGDARRPFVLGALFNGVDKPGADLVKATSSVAARYPRDLDVATQAKGVLAADKGLTVTTKQGPVEVAAGTEIKLAASKGGPPSAVTIETTGQIKAKGDLGVEIAATGPVKITAQAPLTLESTAAVQIKGAAIQVQASGVLQLSGASVIIG